jgi:hypothetical protein
MAVPPAQSPATLMPVSREPHASNATIVGRPSNEGQLSLVSASQPSSLDGELGTAEAAQALRRSPAWIKRHAQELDGRIVDGAYQFPAIAIERRRTTTERITVGGGSRPDRAREAGALAARAFALFASCVPLDEAVVKLEAEPDAILKLHQQWLECRQRTAAWLASETASPSAAKAASIAGPVFDHRPTSDWTCCAGHGAARAHDMRNR